MTPFYHKFLYAMCLVLAFLERYERIREFLILALFHRQIIREFMILALFEYEAGREFFKIFLAFGQIYCVIKLVLEWGYFHMQITKNSMCCESAIGDSFINVRSALSLTQTKP